jgi:hypothetical protein
LKHHGTIAKRFNQRLTDITFRKKHPNTENKKNRYENCFCKKLESSLKQKENREMAFKKNLKN